jgi:nuclear pore complex protein Nup93
LQSGVIEQGAPLLKLNDAHAFNEYILTRAAHAAEQADRLPEAVKLYNLAGEYATVVGCLARALGGALARPGADEQARAVERTAADIVRHYERTNRGAGRERDAVVKMLRIREASDAKDAGRLDVALEVSVWRMSVRLAGTDARPPQIMESTGLIPLDGDVAKITRRAEEFKDLHEALQRNLQTYLTLTMDAIAGIHQKIKSSTFADATRQQVSPHFVRKSTASSFR